MPKITIEEYFKDFNLKDLLVELGAQNVDFLVKEVNHFTEKEAIKRDEITLNYFGEEGVERIVNSVSAKLNSMRKPRRTTDILDIGAGSGFFTTRIASKLQRTLPHVLFYAMDATPAMLLALARKKQQVIPFFGIAENISGNIEKAQEYAAIPKLFDALFSTLMLHHCPHIDRIFKSVRQVLKPRGKTVIIDLCTHSFIEFREEMGDVHLGFDPEQIERAAGKFFSEVTVEKLPGIHCSSSGRSAELFVATLKP